jgi:putative two-component system response regulator
VVDDDRAMARLLVRVINMHGYECLTVTNTQEAMTHIETGNVPLVLTDMNMPGGSGLDLVKRLSAEYPDVATVMVTGHGSQGIARLAIASGAYDYLSKPFTSDEVLVTVINTLRRRSLEIQNRHHRQNLERLVKERTAHVWESNQELLLAQEQLRLSQEETIKRLSIASELRDDDTGKHILRMSRFCKVLAIEFWGDALRAEKLRLASMMHDVGKIGIPDGILRKPRALTPEEFETMKDHTTIGHTLLTGSATELLDQAATIALTHHEHFDGKGYPHGLSGTDIPIEGRIAAVADVFDALTSDRVYRKAFGVGKALAMMSEGRGKQFDPEILDLFIDNLDSFLKIKEESAVTR